MRLWIEYSRLLTLMEMVITVVIYFDFKKLRNIDFSCFVLLFVRLVLTLTCLTGYISTEEFIRGGQQDPWLLNMLKLDMNPAGWVMEQRRKSAHF